MSPQRFAVSAVLCGTLVLNGWIAAELAGPASRSIENDSARIAVDTSQITAIAEYPVDGVSILAIIDAAFADLGQIAPPVRVASASTPDPVQTDVEASAPPFEVPEVESILAALPDPQETLAPVAVASVSASDAAQRGVEGATPSAAAAENEPVDPTEPDPREVLPQARSPVRLVSLFRPDSLEEDLKPAARVVETPNECLVADICIDDYLWAFYDRTPKVDTTKLTARIKATVKKK